ncbi:MAG: 50S ribosomal protein L16 [Caldisericales bacterium]|nr:50S ribosomal protein L16 [Caldisericales bacterium]
MLQPERTKFRKQQRGKMHGLSKGGNYLNFGDFGIQALDRDWVTARQIEAVRLAVTSRIPKDAKMWMRIFPDKPISKKPLETRMGKGKGDTEQWVAVVRPGRIIVEFSGCDEKTAKYIAHIVSAKLPIKSRFVSRKLESEAAL